MDSDIHPAPEEIKKYVAIGSDNYNISVHKQTFDRAFIIVTLIFAVLIVTAVIVTIIFANQRAQLAPAPTPRYFPPPPLTLHKNYGGVNSRDDSVANTVQAPPDGSHLVTQALCSAAENARWVGDHCECAPGFYGFKCTREKHDRSYLGLGVPHEETLGLNIIDDILVEAKSFTPNSCSAQCDTHDRCIGFLYHRPGMCTLLADTVVVPEGRSIAYTHDLEPTLYLKNLSSLYLENRIYLSQNRHTFPLRCWLAPDSDQFASIQLDVVTPINFVPRVYLMGGRFVGLYCRTPFEIRDVPILFQAEGVYIHEPGAALALPQDWEAPLYLIYKSAD
jgi:hypothetical protein